jgi:hypothetical protein
LLFFDPSFAEHCDIGIWLNPSAWSQVMNGFARINPILQAFDVGVRRFGSIGRS